MTVLFAIIVAPILFFLFAWVAATAYRIYFPEEPRACHYDPVVQRRYLAAAGKNVPVGVREIREDQQHYLREHMHSSYWYAGSASDGFPTDWREDLWRRRN